LISSKGTSVVLEIEGKHDIEAEADSEGVGDSPLAEGAENRVLETTSSTSPSTSPSTKTDFTFRRFLR
jgi:hypothetical protein